MARCWRKAVVLAMILACGCRQASLPSSYTSLDGARIHYKSSGQGKKALVFIHGWTCDLSFWRFQQPAFEAAGHLILIDLPGHGQSDKPRIAYTQDLFARAVKAVLEHAGIRSAVLVGHSMGSTVARQFARLYPGKAAALVYVDGPLLRVPSLPSEFEKWRIQMAAFADNFRGPQHKRFTEGFIDSMLIPETPEPLRREIKSKMLAAPQHVAVSALEGIVDPAIWKEDPMDLPVLAIYAKATDLPADNEEYMGRLFPRLDYQLWDGVSHFLMMEQPEKFNRALEAFLEKHGL